ncbi:cysteine hydrolase [Gulosibacter molinativorax]|uniref:Cysteine hydrolase n=2 Tax=Gulosibacter molinativorax TaxID=256821 RepID=A0ABT7C8C9_9MICO|nr:cysteine hydrolase [Gulosibacter molinativorax]
MQEAFRREGGWQCVGYDAAAEQVARLAEAHSGDVIWTKFVRDPQEKGAWGPYYDRWSEFRVDEDSELWDITLPVPASDAVVTLPTFGKWGDELASLTEGHDLVVCGVATDCCVLSTVLPAVDAGRTVTVVTDACAGATAEVHDQALNLMGMLAPMVELTTTDELLAAKVVD